jgi:hypothetical protein
VFDISDKGDAGMMDPTGNHPSTAYCAAISTLLIAFHAEVSVGWHASTRFDAVYRQHHRQIGDRCKESG